MSAAHFSRQFRAAYGETPTAYRNRDHGALASVPGCVTKERTRPVRRGGSVASRASSRIGEASALSIS